MKSNISYFAKIYEVTFDGYFVYVEMQKLLPLDKINKKYYQ